MIPNWLLDIYDKGAVIEQARFGPSGWIPLYVYRSVCQAHARCSAGDAIIPPGETNIQIHEIGIYESLDSDVKDGKTMVVYLQQGWEGSIYRHRDSPAWGIALAAPQEWVKLGLNDTVRGNDVCVGDGYKIEDIPPFGSYAGSCKRDGFCWCNPENGGFGDGDNTVKQVLQMAGAVAIYRDINGSEDSLEGEGPNYEDDEFLKIAHPPEARLKPNPYFSEPLPLP